MFDCLSSLCLLFILIINQSLSLIFCFTYFGIVCFHDHVCRNLLLPKGTSLSIVFSEMKRQIVLILQSSTRQKVIGKLTNMRWGGLSQFKECWGQNLWGSSRQDCNFFHVRGLTLYQFVASVQDVTIFPWKCFYFPNSDLSYTQVSISSQTGSYSQFCCKKCQVSIYALVKLIPIFAEHKLTFTLTSNQLNITSVIEG